MAKKITITEKQAQQFNKLLDACLQISKGYQTPQQLQKNSEAEYGLDYEESLEMAYENIQATAKLASHRVKYISI